MTQQVVPINKVSSKCAVRDIIQTQDSVVQKTETKKKKKKRDYGKQRMFAKTVGVEDNDRYRRFKDKERLLFNISNSKYYVIRFVAKSLFNFKLSFKT